MVAKEWIHPAVEKSVHMVFRNGPVLILAIFGTSRKLGDSLILYLDIKSYFCCLEQR
jgi:hypothetical protein